MLPPLSFRRYLFPITIVIYKIFFCAFRYIYFDIIKLYLTCREERFYCMRYKALYQTSIRRNVYNTCIFLIITIVIYPIIPRLNISE